MLGEDLALVEAPDAAQAMESISPTQKRDSHDAQTGTPQGATAEAPTAELPTGGAVNEAAGAGELQPSLASISREQCPFCAAKVAPDQRYCVECGQRLASARPLLMNEGMPDASGAATASPSRSPHVRMSPNSTLIAGIGTLLLAMGVGVLIGRSGQSSSSKRSNATQILTVPSAGAPSGTTSTEVPPSLGTSTKAPQSAGGSAGGASSKTTPTKPAGTAAKPAKVPVTIGKKGSGAGYQHKHFTGHFFGAESEEEAGEASGKSSPGSKAGKAG